MKNTSRFCLFNLLLMSLLLWGTQDRLLADNVSVKNLHFDRISSFEDLPSEEITQIIQGISGLQRIQDCAVTTDTVSVLIRIICLLRAYWQTIRSNQLQRIIVIIFGSGPIMA